MGTVAKKTMGTISNSHIIQKNTRICVTLMFSVFSFNRRCQESTERLNKVYLRWAFVPSYAYAIVIVMKIKLIRYKEIHWIPQIQNG
jgi:hypothetical protein